MVDLVALADLVRAQLDAEAEDARHATAGPWWAEDTSPRHWGDERDAKVASSQGTLAVLCPEWNGPLNADHIARQCPATTLARVARTRLHVDRLLAETHHVVEDQYYTCQAATRERDGGSYAETDGGGTCTCGRDERVRGYLQLLLPEES